MKITTLTDRRKAIFDKIMARVIIDNNTGCWNWTGPTSGNGRGGGYGRMCLDSQPFQSIS
jgi:antirestriction protein ArdC